ncbi:hypothetical protein NPIL_529461 [Nephila pilipes]|uniref:Uncharacterized protein n=1 Tax=Nephila pilipes TaxID=299642 RepID=A0A8X6N599_NEPPI|nr:hypothetical protein NPIL_529461 [Nephila pilipes]
MALNLMRRILWISGISFRSGVATPLIAPLTGPNALGKRNQEINTTPPVPIAVENTTDALFIASNPEIIEGFCASHQESILEMTRKRDAYDIWTRK